MDFAVAGTICMHKQFTFYSFENRKILWYLFLLLIFLWQVHATFLIDFTKEIDTALLAPNRNASFDATARKLENHIERTISLLRNNLSMGKRLDFRTLLILLIQAQNILNRLIEKNVKYPDNFEWLGQMRYYCDENKIKVKMLLSEWQYGFEYIGNKTRMVITPLTDRCYRTIFVALNQHFGLAIQVCDLAFQQHK